MTKNIEMNIKTDSGYDTIYPKTKAAITEIADIVASEIGLSNGSNVDQAITKLSQKSGIEVSATEPINPNDGSIWFEVLE